MATFRTIGQFSPPQEFQTVDAYLRHGYEPVFNVRLQHRDVTVPSLTIWTALAEECTVGVNPNTWPRQLQISDIYTEQETPTTEQDWLNLIANLHLKNEEKRRERQAEAEEQDARRAKIVADAISAWPERCFVDGWPLAAFVGVAGDRVQVGEIVQWWRLELFAVATEQGYVALERESPEGLKQKENYVCQNEEFSIYYSA